MKALHLLLLVEWIHLYQILVSLLYRIVGFSSFIHPVAR
jgi:hypothetical protein